MRVFGIICLSEYLKQLRFIMLLQKYSDHFCLEEDGADMPVGQLWCWTFYHIKSLRLQEKKIGFIRYITFAFSFSFVVLLFLNHVENMEKIMFIAFIVGNILYYIVGIILAFLFKDNRAFCKYICPVTIFLKPMSYFSVVRVKCDKEKCISCGKCKKSLSDEC